MTARVPLQIGLIGVGNYGGALLEGLLVASSRGGDVPVGKICIYDVDSSKTNGFRSRFPERISVATTLDEILGQCTLNVVGVNSSQLPSLLSDIGRLRATRSCSDNEFLFMDGGVHFTDSPSGAALRYGRIMFTPWVRYCRGIVGFWPGSLSQSQVVALNPILSSLGERWDVTTPSSLQCIRATAGSGIGVMGIVLHAMRDSFGDLGLTEDQSDKAIASLIHGLDQYLIRGGDIVSLSEKVCSQENSLTRIALADHHASSLQAEIKATFGVLKPYVINAS